MMAYHMLRLQGSIASCESRIEVVSSFGSLRGGRLRGDNPWLKKGGD